MRVSFDEPEYTADTTGIGTIRLLEAIRLAGIQTPLLPGLELGDVRRDPAAAERGDAVLPALAVRRRQGVRLLDDPELPRGLRHVRGQRDPVQPRVAAPRGDLRDPQDHPGGRARSRPAGRTTLYMGNLDAVRDWGYAPEYVEGMWRMLQADEPDDYVLATGTGYTVRDFLEISFDHAGLDWEKHVRFDERYLRPTEVDALIGDASKADDKLGWKATHRRRELARIMVDADIEALACAGTPWIDKVALPSWTTA